MSYFGSIKQIIVGGYLVSSVLLFFITTLFIADKDQVAFYFIVIATLVY
jgi:hypothetical protein